MGPVRMVCCLCLGSPPTLPVRPHGNPFTPCVALMCVDCYHEWRLVSGGWDAAQPPPCPCCREPVHHADVPPDPVLCMLAGDDAVTCDHCQTECPLVDLPTHRRGCRPLLVACLRQGHDPSSPVPAGFCLPRPGRHGLAELPCLRASACRWAPTLLHLLATAPQPDEAASRDPAWAYLEETLAAFSRVARGRDEGASYLWLRPVRELFLGATTALSEGGRGRLLDAWWRLGQRSPPQVADLHVVYQLCGPHPILAAALSTLVAAALSPLPTPPPQAAERIRALCVPGRLGLVQTLAADLATPVAAALAAWPPDAPSTVAAVDLWLYALRHGLARPEDLDVSAWRTWWRAARSGARAEAVLRLDDVPSASVGPMLRDWWAAEPGSVLQPADGPFTWTHARVVARYLVPSNPTVWLLGQDWHRLPPQTMNLLLVALSERPTVRSILRAAALVPAFLARGMTHPAVAVPPALVLEAGAAAAVVAATSLDGRDLAVRLGAEHTLMCVHRSMGQDAPWTMSWPAGGRRPMEWEGGWGGVDDQPPPIPAPPPPRSRFGYLALYLATPTASNGGLGRLRRARVDHGLNEELLLTLLDPVRRGGGAWWHDLGAHDDGGVTAAALAVILPTRVPALGWRALRELLPQPATLPLPPVVAAVLVEAVESLVDVTTPTELPAHTVWLAAHGSLSRPAVRRTFGNIPPECWNVRGLEALVQAGITALEHLVLDPPHPLLRLSPENTAALVRLVQAVATPVGACPAIWNLLLHLHARTPLPATVGTSPEPGFRGSLGRLLRDDDPGAVTELLVSAYLGPPSWPDAWTTWSANGRPKPGRADARNDLVRALLAHTRRPGAPPMSPPVPEPLRHAVTAACHEDPHPVHTEVLARWGRPTTPSGPDPLCDAVLAPWWAERPPARLGAFLRVWAHLPPAVLENDDDGLWHGWLARLDGPDVAAPLARTLVLADALRPCCPGDRTIVAACDPQDVAYALRDALLCVAESAEAGLVTELLLGTVRQGSWVLWSALVRAFPGPWYRMVAGSEDFGPLHTVLARWDRGVNPPPPPAMAVGALCQTLSGLLAGGHLRHPGRRWIEDPLDDGDSDHDEEDLPSDVGRALALLWRLAARWPHELGDPLVRTLGGQRVHPLHLTRVDADSVAGLWRAHPGPADALADLLVRWMRGARLEAVATLWAGDWWELLPVAVTLVQEVAVAAHPEAAQTSRRLAHWIGRSVLRLVRERPKLATHLPPGVDWLQWAGADSAPASTSLDED